MDKITVDKIISYYKIIYNTFDISEESVKEEILVNFIELIGCKYAEFY